VSILFRSRRFRFCRFAVVSQLDILHIEGSGPEPLGFVHHLIGRNKEKFSLFVRELPDEPGAGLFGQGINMKENE
jgi:hypothetical protein